MRYTFVVLVCLIHTFLCSVRCWYTCLACFVPPRLAFFSSLHLLHACLYVHAWVYVLSILQSNGTMDTRSKSTFFLLGHPLLLDNMLVCPFICLACFVCPRLAPFVSMFLACSPISFVPFFSSLFPCLLHVHVWSEDTWSASTTS